jgi:hypothetical protein
VPFGLAALFVLGLAVLAIPLDFGSVEFAISGQTATITAPLYDDYSFPVDGMASVALIDDFPDATKIFGANSARLYIGRYYVAGYKGTSHVFIHRNCPPYIVVGLEGGWVIFNGGTQEETRRYFSILEGDDSQ